MDTLRQTQINKQSQYSVDDMFRLRASGVQVDLKLAADRGTRARQQSADLAA